MICGWNRRHGSDGPLRVLLLAGLLAAAAAGLAQEPPDAGGAVLQWADDRDAEPQEQRWLTEDRQWLAARPSLLPDRWIRPRIPCWVRSSNWHPEKSSILGRSDVNCRRGWQTIECLAELLPRRHCSCAWAFPYPICRAVWRT